MKSNKKRIAIISTVGLIYDGITSVILSQMQAMNLSDLDVYIIGTIKVESSIVKKFEDLGCTIINLPSRRQNTLLYWKELFKFIREKKIEVVHVHGNSATMAIEMTAAWLGGAKKRIAHSHNTKCDQVKADKLLRPLFYALTTDRLACGEAAGKWLYRDKTFVIIKNGRDEKIFKYDETVRNQLRREMSLEDKVVIGHVGGFLEQKNHIFLLEILKEISNKIEDVYFVLVGDGVLREKIENKACEIGIKDKIVFTGKIDNVPEVLQVMDGMLLPSLFEGLPLVVLEWQLAGLPCVISDSIDASCAVTELVSFMSLEDNPTNWAKKIISKLKDSDRGLNSKEAIEALKREGYLISDCSSCLRQIYVD